MQYRFLRFPEGKPKAVTFSYDDGGRGDIRLAKTCDQYGIKCTFNISPCRITPDRAKHHLTEKEICHYLLDAGHEVSIHTQ